MAYIDRTNVGFAALPMGRDIGLNAHIFGWGAGIFFLGYFLFEVPSNLFLERLGARVWICRIMVSWGIASGAMAFVRGPTSFMVLRFILGVAEAGLFPGMILYLTYWYPAVYRARVVAALFVAAPVSIGVAGALSGSLLQLHGVWGVAGWKWMFVFEAIPSIVLGVVVYWWLTDRPANATWLDAEEKQWLEERLARERSSIECRERVSAWKTMADSRVIVLAAIYFSVTTASYGLTFFVPQIVKRFGFSDMKTGLLVSLPYFVGTVGMLLLGYSSDRRNERRYHLIGTFLLTAVGLFGVGFFNTPGWTLAAISVTAIGLYGSRPAFWPLPSNFLVGAAAAVGIAGINSIGNLGGFLGPYVVGYIVNATGSFQGGLYFLSACGLMAAVLTWLFIRPPRRLPSPLTRDGSSADAGKSTIT
jgi:ACS family tartrate transporter-like MFS transporter